MGQLFGFSTYFIMLIVNKDCFFLPCLYALSPLFLSYCLARISGMMSKCSGERVSPPLFLTWMGSFKFLTMMYDVSYRFFFVDALCPIEGIILYTWLVLILLLLVLSLSHFSLPYLRNTVYLQSDLGTLSLFQSFLTFFTSHFFFSKSPGRFSRLSSTLLCRFFLCVDSIPCCLRFIFNFELLWFFALIYLLTSISFLKI